MPSEDQSPNYILVRGLLGSYMPGHFRRVQEDLHAMGAKCQIAPTDPAGTLAHNSKLIASKLTKRIESGRPMIFLAHSKGGIETLAALKANEELLQQTSAVVLFQTPKRGAPYLKSLYRQDFKKNFNQRLKEGLHRTVLNSIFAREACEELTVDTELPFVRDIEATRFPFPVFSYSTFSTKNSGWIELQANRIAELEPDKPNDGVFLTEDQVWPQFEHRQIEEVDHAEPTVGSRRINERDLWRRVLAENGLLPKLRS